MEVYLTVLYAISRKIKKTRGTKLEFPIYIEDDSTSEIDHTIYNRNNTNVIFELLHQALTRYETEKDSSISNPLFTDAMEVPENINNSLDTNIRPKDPKLSKINKFSGKCI
uniref:Fam-a protein n=1 Tax=Strongyloides venezuelensis TaxID=75913 RepID=A0A0K0FU65_STRVS